MKFNSMYDYWHLKMKDEARQKIAMQLENAHANNLSFNSLKANYQPIITNDESAQGGEKTGNFSPVIEQEIKVDTPFLCKEITDRTTPWATIISYAEKRDKGCFRDASGKLHPTFKYHDPLFQAAIVKSAQFLSAETGATLEDCNEELLKRFHTDSIAQNSILHTIRFFRDANPSWLTECEACGCDNDPPWDTCHKCGAQKEV